MFERADAVPGPRPAAADPTERPPILELRASACAPTGHGCGLDRDRPHGPAGRAVGVAGVSGNGQRELGDVILGVIRARREQVARGHGCDAWSVARCARRRGVHTRGRAGPGRRAQLTVLENTASPRATYARAEASQSTGPPRAKTWRVPAQRLGVTVPSLDAPLGTLSGGNVQRECWRASWRTGHELIVASTRRAASTHARPPRRSGRCSRPAGRGPAFADLRGPRRAAHARRPPRGAVRRAHRRRGTPGRSRGRGDRSPHDGEPGAVRRPHLVPVARVGGLLAVGLVAFALLLLLFGRNPLRAYVEISRARSAAGTGSPRHW